jgi:hypothetical protein
VGAGSNYRHAAVQLAGVERKGVDLSERRVDD